MRLHIIPALGNIKLDKLTQNDLQQFYSQLKTSGRQCHVEQYGAGLSNATVRGCHMILHAALDKAMQNGLIRINPSVGCKLPPKKAREMKVLTREEMQRFLIQAKEEGYYELFLLELATGMRRGEIMALQWDDLNFDTGELHITKQIYRVKGVLTVSEPKTKTSIRTIVLPPSVVAVLKDYKESVFSRWMFPSPKREDLPIDPATARRKLHDILEHAGCKSVRFHDLRHTFSTMALQSGMDIKTLSTIVGHVSSATTLDIYAHITDEMQTQAAAKIDKGIGKNEETNAPEQTTSTKPTMTDFQPYKGKKRRAGQGYIAQKSENLWEGRYSPMWPDGKKHAKNVYGKTREEVEEKLSALIAGMQAEIREIKANGITKEHPVPDGIPPKKKLVMEYMFAHPEVTNKSLIAREAGVGRDTVKRHYDDIRKAMKAVKI